MKTFNEVIFEHTRPVLTVNCVIFGFDGKELNILLIRRDTHDHKEKWALPGALASMSETLEETARRSIREEANIDNVFLKQIGAFSSVTRVPNERVICIAYYGLLKKSKYTIATGSDAIEVKWFDKNTFPEMILDHQQIAHEAFETLRNKLHNDPVALELLDKEFSLGELQKIYEVIYDKKLDRRNFQRKLLSSGLFLSKKNITNTISKKKCTIKYSFDRSSYDKIKKEIKRNPIDI